MPTYEISDDYIPPSPKWGLPFFDEESEPMGKINAPSFEEAATLLKGRLLLIYEVDGCRVGIVEYARELFEAIPEEERLANPPYWRLRVPGVSLYNGECFEVLLDPERETETVIYLREIIADC